MWSVAYDADKLSGVGINSSGGPMLIFVILMSVLIINFDRNFNVRRAQWAGARDGDWLVIQYLRPGIVTLH